jgi:hypothetical protein
MAIALSVTGGVSADTGQWSIVANSIDTGANAIMASVACAGTTCWAVGGLGTLSVAPGADPAVLEGTTGNGWSFATDPSSTGGTLEAVTCVDAGDCWAVGTAIGDQTLIEQYVNGAWAFEPSPALPPEATLNGVSCVSASDCWAVGSDGPPGSDQTLIEHYDGTGWTVVSSPNSTSSGVDALYAVSCPAANACWAVGIDYTNKPFIEQYDGTNWVVDTRNLADLGPGNILQGITCVSPTSCWAVGWQGNITSTFTQTVIEQYDGSGWSRVPSPNPIGGEWGVNFLNGVSCDSTGACWAVGQSEGVEGLYNPGQSLIVEYTGAGGWTAVTNPDPGLSGDAFRGVACGVASCVAAGTNGGAPLLAQGPLAQLAEGGATAGSSPSPSSGSTGKTTSDPAVPDTGGTGSPWAPLLLAGGAVIAASGYRNRRRHQRTSAPRAR